MDKILIVDDENSIRELVKYNLTKEGFQIDEAEEGNKALELIAKNSPNLIVLDLMLPGIDGLEICRKLRQNEKTAQIPIIMLTARAEEVDKIVGLEMGADDYLTKPFSPRELVARVKALLRRAKPVINKKEDNIIRDGLVISPERFEVKLNDRNIDLTPKEFQLLVQLAIGPGKVFTREFLLENIWGYDYLGDTRTVDVHIRHLRQKLEVDPSQPEFIETIRGIGYKFKG